MDFVRQLLQPVIFLVVIGGIWEFGVRYFEIHPYLLPPVSDILQAGWLSRGELWQHGIITFWEILIGFAAAVVCGVLVAVCVFFSAVARRTIYPMVTALQSLPKIALAPLMIVWFGYGIMSKLIMTFLFAFFPIVISTLGGLSSTQETLLEHFRALRASPWSTFWRLRVPAALPSFIDGCKIAMPLAVIGAIIGEFVGSERGLGNLILFTMSAGRTDLLFATLLAVTVLSLVLYWAIEALGRLVWWRSL